MTREEVFIAIDGEREFVDSLINDPQRPDMNRLRMGEALTAIRYNLNKAEEAYYTDAPAYNYQETLAYLRKVAGLIVDQGEQNGMPSRP